MEPTDDLEVFFSEFYFATSQLRKLIPSLDGCIFSSICTQISEEEVFIGLPSLKNSQPMFNSLSRCPPPNPTKCSFDSSKFTARLFLSRLELIATIASLYELTSVECAAWQAMESLANQSARVIDETYALVNRAYLKVRIAEATCYTNREELSRKISRVQVALKSRATLFEAYEQLVLTVKLPTHHANLQCVVIDALMVYVEKYFDWDAINSRLNLTMLRHKEFLGGKFWAAVYCNGFLRWLRLHARCFTGTPPSPNETVSPSDVQFTHPLYEATHVKAHGRTLVKFMLGHCEQRMKAAGKASPAAADKENFEPRAGDGEGVFSAWSEASLSTADLVNLWLGTRLLMHGSIQLAELYTLLGTTKEARLYQFELLRIAQRFHNPSCTQTAICLMAYTDMISQRKWSFDLRLRQLKHILTSEVLLKDTATLHRPQQTSPSLDDASPAFIKRKQASGDRQDSEESSGEYVGMATNPLVSATTGGIAAIFPTSPVKKNNTAHSSSFPSNGYPAVEDIAGNLTSESQSSDNAAEASAPASVEGVMAPAACAHRVLNGAMWAWLGEVGDLVRSKVVGQDHFFEALIIPASSLNGDSDDINTTAHSPSNLPHDFEEKCLLEETPTEKSVPGTAGAGAPASKAARAAARQRTVAGRSRRDTSPRPAPHPRAPPAAPRRLATVLREQEKAEEEEEAASRVERTRRATAIAALEKMAPPTAAASRRGPTDTPSTTTRRGPRRGPKADADYKATSMSSSVTPSLFDHRSVSASGYTFGPIAPIAAGLTRSRGHLNIYQDEADRKTSMPRLRLFKSPEPPNPTTDNDFDEPTESCPLLSQKAPRPRNIILATRWAQKRAPRISGLLQRPLEADPPAEVLRAQDALAERLYDVYRTLSSVPVPHLMRPVCQWLGLRWLAKGNEEQAGRFFGQSVGLSTSGLHATMLCSKVNNARNATNTSIKTALSAIFSLIAPNDAPRYLEHLRLGEDNITTAMPSAQPPLAVVIQLTLIDELGAVMTESDYAEFTSCACVPPPARHLVPGGLGARDRAHLVATRWVIRDNTGGSSQSRVLYNFSVGGIQSLDAYTEMQAANVDSMQVADREQFWRQRFSLDNKLTKMIRDLREEWFSKDDISWLHGIDLSLEFTEHNPTCPFVLILDRRLVYLPWEWLIWSPSDSSQSPSSLLASNNQLPHISPVFRNFSFASVVSQLASFNSPTTTFDPQSTFYVLNPEANLPSTESTFTSYIKQNFDQWTGVVGRRPAAQDVIRGFTEHDLFVYLGHGNGSRFLMSTFDEGLVAKAVALIIGCSSGKPRLEGRYEAFASIFNHIIAGCPTVLGLLWDVTDKDIDRFTESFLTRWLKVNEQTDLTATLDKRKMDSLTWQIFRAVDACKLKSLVGKSVITYGLPAVPRHKPQ